MVGDSSSPLSSSKILSGFSRRSLQILSFLFSGKETKATTSFDPKEAKDFFFSAKRSKRTTLLATLRVGSASLDKVARYFLDHALYGSIPRGSGGICSRQRSTDRQILANRGLVAVPAYRTATPQVPKSCRDVVHCAVKPPPEFCFFCVKRKPFGSLAKKNIQTTSVVEAENLSCLQLVRIILPVRWSCISISTVDLRASSSRRDRDSVGGQSVSSTAIPSIQRS